MNYKTITSKSQYYNYARILEALVDVDNKTNEMNDEIDLLTLLIEKWDKDHNTFDDVDPVEILQSLMAEKNLKATDLVEILDNSKGHMSGILNYKNVLSKEIINTLPEHFKVSL